MDSFNDVMEDAIYVHALTRGRLELIRPWPSYTDEEIHQYIEQLRQNEPEKLTLEVICQQPLGFYLFTRFLRSIGRHDLANFLVESASLQINSSMNAAKLLRKFVNNFLLNSPIGVNTSSRSSQRRRSSFTIPFFQANLARSKYAPITPETSEMVSMKPRKDQCMLITGPTVDRILSKLGISSEHATVQRTLHSRKNSNLSITHQSMNNNNIDNYAPTTDAAFHLSPRSQSATSLASPHTKRLSINTEKQILYEITVLDSMIFNIVKTQYETLFLESKEYQLLFRIQYMIQFFRPQETEFDFIRVLGRGGFGKVTAVRSCITGKLYALKSMNKKRIKLKRAAKMCIAERDVLELIQSSPYIVGLKYAFMTAENICLILDLMIGGDLSYHLNEANFSIEQAKYYTARLILALASLHDHQYVYRDLKPENILLDAEGQSKLSDLGLVAKVPERGLSTVCGTRGYWAPEILSINTVDSNSYYSYPVDWFSLGCCLYEFLTGSSPFRTEKAYLWKAKPNQTIEKMTKQEKDYSLDHALLEMEPDVSMIDDLQARDLINKLLIKDPKHRLGTRHYEDIMNHEWFQGIQWSSVHAMIPPFKPSLAKGNAALSSEIGDFDDDALLTKVVWEEQDEEIYQSWYYLSPSAIQEEFVEYLVHQDKESAADRSRKSDECCCMS